LLFCVFLVLRASFIFFLGNSPSLFISDGWSIANGLFCLFFLPHPSPSSCHFLSLSRWLPVPLTYIQNSLSPPATTASIRASHQCRWMEERMGHEKGKRAP
jgi:hypothetical protein